MSGATAGGGLGPFDPYWTENVPPPRRGRAWRGRLALGVAAVVAMIGAAALAPGRPPVAELGARVAEATRPLEMVDAAAAPALSLNGIDPGEVRYEARLDPATGDRTDAVIVGALDGDGPGLRLEFWRDGGRRAAPSLYVAAAEIAAGSGAVVERLEAAQDFVSAQGPVEWAELTLAGRERACAAFRLAPRQGGGALRGVVCGAAGATLDAAAIGCLVEKLGLTKAGRDAGFAELLRAPPRRAACRTPLG